MVVFLKDFDFAQLVLAAEFAEVAFAAFDDATCEIDAEVGVADVRSHGVEDGDHRAEHGQGDEDVDGGDVLHAGRIGRLGAGLQGI